MNEKEKQTPRKTARIIDLKEYQARKEIEEAGFVLKGMRKGLPRVIVRVRPRERFNTNFKQS